MGRKSKKSEKSKGEMIFVDPNEPKRVAPLQVIPYLFPEVFLVLLGMIGAAGMGITPVLLYRLLGEMVGLMSGTIKPSSSQVVNAAAQVAMMGKISVALIDLAKKMSYIAAGAAVAALIQFFLMNLAHGLIGTKLKKHYFFNLLDQEIGYFDMKRVGELLGGMTESMEIIQEGCSNKIGEVTQHVVQTIFGLVMAIVTGWKMALVMIAVMPVFVALLFTTAMTIGIVQRIVNKMSGKATGIANEVISSMRTIRSMDGEEREKKRFYNQIVSLHTPFLVRGLVSGTTVGLAIFVNWSNIALGFWWGGRLMSRGEITFTELFQVFGFSLMAVLGIVQALRIFPEFAKTTQSTKDLLKVIKRSPILRASGGVQPEKVVGQIKFENVYFSYPTRPNVQVLKNFSLEISPGQSVALVGASGSGKSTIVGLIEKFYEQESGRILLDGVDLREIDPRWLHRNIGIVTQEPTLFATTITENILYAVKFNGRTYTQEDVENAAKAANAHDFITALPDGYNTMLGERGVSMSGGQKQRIAIARAMIQDPALLLLDEATSALDTQSESIVQDALNKLMKGRTSIVIAHRLSTVIDCNMICVMNKGEMKEKGTHQELLKIENGYYYKLASKQMLFGKSEEQTTASTSIQINDVSDTE